LDGQLAQLAALVAHGNHWLAGERSEARSVAAGSTFQYVNDVTFALTTGRFRQRTISSADPAAWLEGLADRKVASLWLDPRPILDGPLPQHMAAAFANGAPSSVLAHGPRAERWVAVWTVGRPGATDNRIWDVRYLGWPDRAGLGELLDVETARTRLVAEVIGARDLAARFGWSDWARWFDEALASGESTVPVARWHDDVLPGSAALTRRQLFALASGSYVFGGMGSWNDLAPTEPQDEAEYRLVTERVYSAVVDAVAASVNPESMPSV
jgi:hypothetical protein